MVILLAYLRLLRFPILVMIAVIQYGIRWFILEPMLAINGYELIVTETAFAYLVLSSVLIAAGGYAINDYFDVKIDRVNKNKKVIVDRYVKRRVAMMLHMVLSGLGLTLAFYFSYKIGLWQLSSLFLFAVFTLWYYSTTLQHQALVGNLAIALLAGFVPLVVGLFEIPLQNQAHPEIVAQLGYSIFNVPAFWIIGYAAALFILTLVREISKDVIDVRGDRLYGATTIPIVMGIKKTKFLLISLYALFGGLFSWAFLMYLYVHENMSTLFFAVCILLVSAIVLIAKARTKRHFSFSVNLNNVITMILVLSMFVIKLSIENYFV